VQARNKDLRQLPRKRADIVAASQLPPLRSLAAKRWLRYVRAHLRRCMVARRRRQPNEWEGACAEIAAAHIFDRCAVKPCWSKLDPKRLHEQLDASPLAPWAPELLLELCALLEFLDDKRLLKGLRLWRHVRDLKRLTMPFRFERLWQEHWPLFEIHDGLEHGFTTSSMRRQRPGLLRALPSETSPD
jgi:hypothetical protein